MPEHPPESQAGSPEQSDPNHDRLLELGGQFGDDIAQIEHLRTALIERALGPDAMTRLELEQEFDRLNLPELPGMHPDSMTPDKAQETTATSALHDREVDFLQGTIGSTDPNYRTDSEIYSTADGQARVRQTFYRVRNGVISADQHDFGNPADLERRLREIDIEIAADINGHPVSPDKARELAARVHDWRGILERVMQADDQTLRAFLEM
jgi:hypothetical protein